MKPMHEDARSLDACVTGTACLSAEVSGCGSGRRTTLRLAPRDRGRVKTRPMRVVAQGQGLRTRLEA